MGRATGEGRTPVTTAKILANAAKVNVLGCYEQSDRSISPFASRSSRVSEARFERVFADHTDDVVFVHAGLRALKRAFDRNPYEYLRDVLFDAYDSVLVPGFTPSFRRSGVYHKRYSRPEYGAFAREFLSDAEYRTNDAIHSILVNGKYRFPRCDHHHTFGSSGCWGRLDDDNVLYCNVGTPWIVSTQHHYIEHRENVPYNEPVTHEGIVYHDDQEYERCRQRNYTYTVPARRSAPKVTRYLRQTSVVNHYDLGGLQIDFFRARDLRRALEPKVRDDPYYLIK